jgi:hypothetical protein
MDALYNIPDVNPALIPANPIPLMDIYTHNQLDNYINMIMNLHRRIKIRSILLRLIDCSIIYEYADNGDKIEINNIRREARNHIVDPNDMLLLDAIMQIVEHATPAQRIHIFNRIAKLFHNNIIVG